MSSSSGAADASGAVSDVLDCLDRCGSVVVQSMGVLTRSADDGDSLAGVLSALESLRGLSEERLDGVCADEAAAYDMVQLRLSGLDECVGAEAVSGYMALYTLGCRNGLALCGTAEVIELVEDLYASWIKSVSTGGDDYAAGAASGALWYLSGLECGSKMLPESRGPAERSYQVTFKAILVTVAKTFTEQRVCEVFTGCMKAGILSHEDTSLACGWCITIPLLGYPHPGAFSTANEVGVFSTALALYRRVEPSPLPAEWWVSMCGVVDVTSVRLTALWMVLTNAKRVPSATQCVWWSELLDHAIRMSKLNASAGLSGRDTMSFMPVCSVCVGRG